MGFGRKNKTGERSLLKPAFWMITFCSLMATTATLGEKFLTGDNPMDALTGLISPQEAEASPDASNQAGQMVLITPSGELTPEQRAWLLEQAKKGAPIPLDKTGAPVDGGAQRDATLDELERALKASQGG